MEKWNVETDKRGNISRLILEEEQNQFSPTVRPSAEILTPTKSTSHIQGTRLDKARAFSIETQQLSIIVAASVSVLAWHFGQHPFLSSLSIIYALTGYFITWILAYVLHTFASPEGVQLFESIRLWNHIDREQVARHRAHGIDSRSHNIFIVFFLVIVQSAILAGVTIGLLFVLLYTLGAS